MNYVPNFLVEYVRRSLPDQDDLAVVQLAVTFLPVVFSILTIFAWGIVFFLAGFTLFALVYLVFAALLTVLYLVALVQPRLVLLGSIGIGFLIIALNVIIHILSGGFMGGLWTLAWLPLAPLTVYFAAGRRSGMATLALVIVAIVAVTLIDPRSVPPSPPIPYALILAYNLYTLLLVAMMGYLWAENLISQMNLARQQADSLLLNILPRPIAARLKKEQSTIADSYDEVTVLFADIVDFTTMSAAASPVAVVDKLNRIFSDFDTLAAKYGLEKIKTIGDAYMVAGGLPQPRPDHAEAVAAFAVEMLDTIGRHRSWTGEPIRLRVGINTGPVVAGVIGKQKFIYDLWGDAVNVASRMESNGMASQIQVTAAVKEKLGGRYLFQEREPIFVKGKGQMVTYLLYPRPAGQTGVGPTALKRI